MEKPFPPLVIRPPAHCRQEAGPIPVKPQGRRFRGPGGGMLGSLAIHGFLIAAAWSFTLVVPTPADGDGGNGPADSSGFEMTLTPALPPAGQSETAAKIAPLAHQSFHPLPCLAGESTVRNALSDSSASLSLPPVEPMSGFVTETIRDIGVGAGQPAKDRNSSPAPGGRLAGGASSAGHGRLAGLTQRLAPPPKLLHAPPPGYPAAAKAANISGRVAVLIRVRADGSAATASVFRSCGNCQLDQSAVAAARMWTFSSTPSLKDGMTIPVLVNVTFTL